LNRIHIAKVFFEQIWRYNFRKASIQNGGIL
jgi:hypothetical protein